MKCRVKLRDISFGNYSIMNFNQSKVIYIRLSIKQCL